MVVDALSRMSIDSFAHFPNGKEVLWKQVHRLDKLGIRLEDSQKGDFMVNHKFDSSFLVEMKSKQHINPLFMVLKELVLRKSNESFSKGGMRYLGTKVVCMCWV